MRARWLLVMLCVIGLWTSNAYAADPLPTGKFTVPFNENQIWEACSSRGYKPKPDQYHMEKNVGYGKYHFGEDWNGVCGNDTDLGKPLYAIADGVVQRVDLGTVSGKGNQLHIRYAIPYAKGASGVAMFDSVYLHLNSIQPSIVAGAKVVRGQTIATLGRTGLSLNEYAHLHWEIQWDKNLPETNPYQTTLTKALALKYRAPSLIVDDRRVVKTVSPSTFYMDQDAPSSTAYISYNGVNKSLRQAVSAGWIKTVDIQQWDASAGMWRTYSSADDIFFRAGNWYALWVRVSGATLNIPIPGNRFQDDRARLDMIRAVETNSMFLSVKTEFWTYIPSWDPNWEWRMMGFGRTTSGDGYVGHITNKTNPLLRYTIIWNNATGTWGPWVLVDWNRLY